MRLIIILMVVVQLPGCFAESDYRPRNGDIIFQTSRSSQSLAIQLATDSPYSHIGIVYILDDAPFVFEAVQPVKLTPLDEWVAQGDRGHFVVKRLRNADSVLSADKLAKMRSIGEAFVGRDYDLYFEWSDDRIYCSELVWKVFNRGAGIRLGELEKFSDFDFSHPAVQVKLKERFGNRLPMGEVVVSPAAIFKAPNLETVYEN